MVVPALKIEYFIIEKLDLQKKSHTPKIFEKVQSERLRRSNIEITPDGKKRKTHKYSSKKPNIDKIYDE